MHEVKSALVILFGIVVVTIFGYIIFSSIPSEDNAGKVEEQTQYKELTKTEKINRQFSAWNGEHRKLGAWIKQRMNDPSSYEFVSSSYSEGAGYLVVLMKYRGKNAFGTTVINSIKAKVDIETGDVLGIVE